MKRFLRKVVINSDPGSPYKRGLTQRLSDPALSGVIGLSWLVALALMFGACREAGIDACSNLLEAQKYEVAVVTCEQQFEETGDEQFALKAARAHLGLGRPDQILVWAKRLEGGSGEAGAYSLAAAAYLQKNQPEEAKQAYRRAVDLSLQSGDSGAAAGGLYGLYYVSWGQSEYREALDYAAKCQQQALLAGDARMQALAAQALFSILIQVGDLEGAERALQVASYADLSDSDKAHLLANRGALRLRQGRPELAQQASRQALETAGSEGDRFFRSVYLNLAEASLARSNLDEAAGHLESAWRHAASAKDNSALFYYQAQLHLQSGQLAQAEEVLNSAFEVAAPIPDWAWQLHYLRGQVAEQRGDLSGSESGYRASIQILEDLRTSLGFNDFKAWLLEQKRKPYEALFRLRATSNRARDALAIVERVKARAFLDAFVQSTSASGPSGSGRALDVGRVTSRMDSLSMLLPAMSESPVARSLPLENILETIGPRHFLVFFQAGEEIWLFYPRTQRVAMKVLPGSAQEVHRLVDRYLARRQKHELASQLGELLLPRDSLPAPGGLLHIVTDGNLGRLPFAALRHSNRFLVQDYPIVYVPSLSGLAAAMQQPVRDYQPPVVMGDPDGDLPEARGEVRQVALRLGAAPALGPAATGKRFFNASRARILHLSTHTGLDAGGPWLSLADGKVQAAAVVKERVAPELVVLASCASAARRGSGLWGSLGAAFLAAGSRSVLASLWSVEDLEAKRFVMEFYRQGGASDSPSALARTQRRFIESGEPVSVWASYVLFGSGPATQRQAAGPDKRLSENAKKEK